MNYCATLFVVKTQKSMEISLNFTTKNVAISSSTVHSNGDYLFANTMDIYHDLREYP